MSALRPSCFLKTTRNYSGYSSKAANRRQISNSFFHVSLLFTLNSITFFLILIRVLLMRPVSVFTNTIPTYIMVYWIRWSPQYNISLLGPVSQHTAIYMMLNSFGITLMVFEWVRQSYVAKKSIVLIHH
jgi:hypothetical protein